MLLMPNIEFLQMLVYCTRRQIQENV